MHDAGKRVDPMLLVESLRSAEQYDKVGGAAYLAELGRQVPTAAHAEYYANIVADRSVLRSLIHAGTEIVHDAYESEFDTREKLGRAEEKIFAILENRGSGDPPRHQGSTQRRPGPPRTPASATTAPVGSKPASSTSTGLPAGCSSRSW